MRIFIEMKGESNEWAIIELQGMLESKENLLGSKIGNIVVGEDGVSM